MELHGGRLQVLRTGPDGTTRPIAPSIAEPNVRSTTLIDGND